ncbi:tRNA (adenosine(37)-N6)-threonylcarbamoyltransferase complex ATPase subunit type 1 TsaE ['Camptotheca acuminata' phytoplasma]|uniref:tRNA (adenosine(37)-N6)-threonylcarbamoyltransferase complex ATPase subunit type 1 TsaE n=1 Tax='Camptotheca acuminata' phytoplasma TaxID=3239192 RepID=UPI00351A8E29
MENIYNKTTFSRKQTKEIGAFLCQKILNNPNSNKENNIIILEGRIGSGKTVFVKGIAKELGIKEPINSPTFLLLKTYSSKTRKLHHLDLYRFFNVNQKKEKIIPEIDELLENIEKEDIVVIETSEDMSFFSFWRFYVKIHVHNIKKRFISINQK